jgi:hypothetical protein
MIPPPTDNHPCGGCALQEARDGRVCPVARDAFGLPDVETQRHAEALHAAILAEAQQRPAFAELVRHDAMSHTAALPASIRLGLLAAPAPVSIPTDGAKEVIRVALPPRTAR